MAKRMGRLREFEAPTWAKRSLPSKGMVGTTRNDWVRGNTPKHTTKWWGLVKLAMLSPYPSNRRTRKRGESLKLCQY